MYKGKFNQSKKGGNVQDILAQRNQPAAPEIPELKPRKAAAPQEPQAAPAARPAAKAPQRPAQPRPAGQKPAPQKAAQRPVPQKAPAKAAPQAPPKRKGPRLGGVIFYTLYFMFILVFFIATFIGLLWLRGWLVDYQASQPTVKSEQVFTQLFTDPDWDALYQAAGAKDSPYEGRDAYVAYMEEKVGGTPLTYLETSAGLSGGKKYVVRLGNEKVASFTLVDKNKMGETTLENIGELPDWQLGSVEVFFERSGSYRIELMSDHTAAVNGVPLDDSFTIQKATTKAEKYLPDGITSAKTHVQEVTGLMALPTVTVTDKQGNPVEVTYDEATRTFTARTETNTISEEEKELARKAAETFCLYMLEKADRGDLAKYFETSSTAYKAAASMAGGLWVQDFSKYEFRDESIGNYERYSDDMFSVRLSWTVAVTRTNGTEKTFPYDNTLFFRKGDSDKWKVFEQIAEDVSVPQGQVRLTFMDGSTQLHSDFFMTDADKIITPVIPVPEGKVFSGWVREEINENGVKELILMFQPDPTTGEVVLPEGTNLLPMTLYALFEDPEDAAAREQTPETAPAEEPTEVTE